MDASHEELFAAIKLELGWRHHQTMRLVRNVFIAWAAVNAACVLVSAVAIYLRTR